MELPIASLPPSRFNATAASKLRLSQLVPSSPGGAVIRSYDLPPHVCQGHHVFPGPGRKFGDSCLLGDSKAVLPVILYCPVSHGIPQHMESPLRTLCLFNAGQPSLSICQHRMHVQLQSCFKRLLLAHVWPISFPLLNPPARNRVRVALLLKRGHHLTVKHICSSVNKYLLSSI